jgi:fatty-acyl-CoA synthase
MLSDLFDKAAREARFVSTLLGVGLKMRSLAPEGSFTVADAIEKSMAGDPGRAAIHFQGRTISYRELDAAANRMARFAKREGIAKGDVVALLMENRPEFLFTWLGLAKIGVTAALINTNLTGLPLAHSLRVSGAKHLVLGAELAESYATVESELEAKPKLWTTGGADRSLDTALAAESDAAVGADARAGIKASDPLFYIYTSGTTGLPKAARFSHFRFLATATAAAGITGVTVDDRMYVALPLYHTAGGVMATGAALVSGASVVIARKFSTSRFWTDIAESGATTFQYIGELCRYLLNSPESPDETRHRLRLCIGNGLRPEVWEPFQKRFRIPQIIEFYGATEGNVVLMNLDNKVGSIGRIPPWVAKYFPTRLVKFDPDAGEPLRGPDGLCIECGPNEVGEAVGRIGDDPAGRFEGYTDAKESEKKRLRDVLQKGDVYFRTGDLLRRDEDGYYYFIDRIGDTFRWKGENVATSEVAEVLSRFGGIKEANVYGVQVPGADGRACMASIVPNGELDLAALHAHLTKQLPVYARPLFLRVQGEMIVTATFKHRKVELVDEGYDPAKVGDRLYFADPEQRAFVPLDADVYTRIQAAGYRL